MLNTLFVNSRAVKQNCGSNFVGSTAFNNFAFGGVNTSLIFKKWSE